MSFTIEKGMRICAMLSERECSAVITPPQMNDLFWISCFGKDDPDSPAPDKHGYQRDPIEKRIPGIAAYYLQPGAIFTPLTLSVRIEVTERDEFLDMWNAADVEGIRERWGKAVVSVIDGQHRFLGLVQAWEQDPTFCPNVPVTLIFGLTFAQEAEQFDLINSTQRKLPKALIEITKADVTEVDKMDHPQRVRLVATSLARHEDSVWHDDVNLTGARDPNKPVTYEGLRRSTANMFPRELMERLDARKLPVEAVARKYWGLVAEACDDAWNPQPRTVVDPDTGETKDVEPQYRIRELVGVASLAKLGRDIITSSLEHDNVDKRMAELVARLSEVDWEKTKDNPWMSSQAGFAGQKDLYSALYAWVYTGRRPGED